jgi:Mechanosensitive ion channel, conserved TM helix
VDVFGRVRDALAQIGRLLPPLLFAVIILGAGFVVARILERLVDGFLDRVKFDRSAARWGVTEAVERTGTRLDPARVVGKLAFWIVMLIVILLAASALGVQNLGDVFTNLVGYIPSVFAAIIVIVLGLVLGEFVRALILASAGGVEGVPTLARVAKGMIILISVFMALQQIGVAADIVSTAFTLIVGAVALAVALAFGLGNTALAGEVTRRWVEAGRVRRQAPGARRGSAAAGGPGEAPPTVPPAPPPAGPQAGAPRD